MSSSSFPSYGRCKIVWEIDQFTPSMLTDANLSDLVSQPLAIGIKSHYCNTINCWRLQLRRNRSCLSLYFDSSSEIYQKYHRHLNRIAFFEIGILNADGYLVQRTRGKLDQLTYIDRLGRLFNFRDIATLEKTVLVDKKFRIFIRLDFIEHKSPLPVANAMSDQFEMLFNNEKFSDFKITSGEQDCFFVHKNILSIRSPVFNTMMETKMLENKENKVAITDISPRALEEFLRFLYSGKVNDINEIASELLYAANKYDVPDLKPFCVLSLVEMISTANVLDTMMLAELHGEVKLTDFCIDFVKWHYEEVEECKASWSQLSSTLYKRILDAVINFDLDSNYKITSSYPIKVEAQRSRASLPLVQLNRAFRQN